MIEASASRRIPLPAARLWPLAGDGARLSEWFALVRESEADGPPGPGQRHVVRGPWGPDRVFAIERSVEAWEEGRLVRWRDLSETLDGAPPPGRWHRGTTLEVRLEPDGDGTLVTVTGRQLPAAGWAERIEAARPATTRMLEESLAALERAAAP